MLKERAKMSDIITNFKYQIFTEPFVLVVDGGVLRVGESKGGAPRVSYDKRI
jgi:hypothetical protein